MVAEEFQTELLDMFHRVFDRHDSVQGEQVWNFADFQTSLGIVRVDGNRRAFSPATADPRQQPTCCASAGPATSPWRFLRTEWCAALRRAAPSKIGRELGSNACGDRSSGRSSRNKNNETAARALRTLGRPLRS